MKKFLLKNRKAKGFTLVELLIVLIIIGILAGALLLVAGAGTDKANATKIVSNLRSAKAAALMVYADVNGLWDPISKDAVLKYLDKGTDTDKLEVTSAEVDGSTIVYVAYDLDDFGAGVKQKLVDLMNTGVPLLKEDCESSFDTEATKAVMQVN